MEEQLKQALDFSNYRQSFSIQRKTLKEKIEAKLSYGASGGIFKIDQTLIAFVKFLIDQERTQNVPLIDANGNPVLIPDLNIFMNEILDRYFTSVYEYHEQYQNLRKSRSVEKLLDL